jgi:hypothetical protein
MMNARIPNQKYKRSKLVFVKFITNFASRRKDDMQSAMLIMVIRVKKVIEMSTM